MCSIFFFFTVYDELDITHIRAYRTHHCHNKSIPVQILRSPLFHLRTGTKRKSNWDLKEAIIDGGGTLSRRRNKH